MICVFLINKEKIWAWASGKLMGWYKKKQNKKQKKKKQGFCRFQKVKSTIKAIQENNLCMFLPFDTLRRIKYQTVLCTGGAAIIGANMHYCCCLCFLTSPSFYNTIWNWPQAFKETRPSSSFDIWLSALYFRSPMQNSMQNCEMKECQL